MDSGNGGVFTKFISFKGGAFAREKVEHVVQLAFF